MPQALNAELIAFALRELVWITMYYGGIRLPYTTVVGTSIYVRIREIKSPAIRLFRTIYLCSINRARSFRCSSHTFTCFQ